MALTDSLTHYYKFDSDSTDSVGSNNGTDTNTPTYTSGKISNAFTCASASSQYTSFSNTGFFPYGTNTYTLNVWAKFNTTSKDDSIIMTYASPGMLLFYKTALNQIVHSKGGVVDLTYSWGGVDTNYHMWTFVGDGSGMRTYLDGNSTPVASNGNTSNIVDWATSVTCGAYKSSGSLVPGWYLNGQLDEMGIWTRALTTSEISQLYNGGSGLQYPFTTTSSSPLSNLALLGVG